MNSKQPIARFRNAQFSYGTGEPVFKDVTLDLHEGTFYFLTGVSGAGKSTFLRMLHLSHLPTLGNVSVFDRDVTTVQGRDRAELRQKMGYIFQDFKLLPHLTVLENMTLPLDVRGHNKEEARDHGMQLIEWLNLKGLENRYPHSLSGGQQQRIAIGRAVITRPTLVLADEPTGNIDEKGGRNIISILEDLNRLGTTVVMATHNLSCVHQSQHPVIHIENHTVSVVTKESPAKEVKNA